ncbi:hypothetical protein ElyMa_005909400 [Elysia marginata]|uniref:Uncharacterized protein n=1 Tax=Elysia marginata TaxID=1093978 RepID=A0AAV4G8H5_9GAST|nr:hypothetical protein ElyMa_005909400 [Elysia marginata]
MQLVLRKSLQRRCVVFRIFFLLVVQNYFNIAETVSTSFTYEQMVGDVTDCRYQVFLTSSLLACGMKASAIKSPVFRYDSSSKQCSLCSVEDMVGYNEGAGGHVWVEQDLQETSLTDSSQARNRGGPGAPLFEQAIIAPPPEGRR